MPACPLSRLRGATSGRAPRRVRWERVRASRPGGGRDARGPQPVSRRDTVELCEELFGARISTGTVDAILTRTADALELPYEELVRALRRSGGRLNIDETGWRLKGQRQTLWGAFTEKIAVYRIACDRHEDRARELLDGHQGIVTSDRWWAYNYLPLAAGRSAGRICNATSPPTPKPAALSENSARPGCGSAMSCSGPGRSTSTPASAKNSSAGSDCYAASSNRSCAPTPARRRATNAAAAWHATCSKSGPRSGPSAKTRGVKPTNNHAERGLRGAVIYRKLSLGSQSETGEHRIERLLSASITCRLQHRSLFEYLDQLLTAQSRGDPIPQLA